MRPIVRTILRWSVIHLIVIQSAHVLLVRFFSVWLFSWPVSWLIYAFAGREAHRHGGSINAAMAGAGVAALAQVATAVRLAIVRAGAAAPGDADVPKGFIMALAVTLAGAGVGVLGGLTTALHQKRAIAAGLLTAAVLAVGAVLRSPAILAPMAFLVALVPAHNIGTAEDPFYEATPLHALAGITGFVLTALLYAGIFYGIMAAVAWARARRV